MGSLIQLDIHAFLIKRVILTKPRQCIFKIGGYDVFVISDVAEPKGKDLVEERVGESGLERIGRHVGICEWSLDVEGFEKLSTAVCHVYILLDASSESETVLVRYMGTSDRHGA